MPGLHTRWAFHGSSAVAALLHALSPMKEQALSVLSKNWLILVQLRNPLSPIQSLAAWMNCHFVSHCQKFNQQQTCDIQDSQNRGFQPLMSGTRGNALWGSGTYFARDAKLPGWKSVDCEICSTKCGDLQGLKVAMCVSFRYVYDGGFCSPGMDGSRQILLLS